MRWRHHKGPIIKAKVRVYSKLSQLSPLKLKYDKKILIGREGIFRRRVEIFIFKKTLAFFSFFSIKLIAVLSIIS